MKRACDVVISGTALVLLLPFLILISITVYFFLGSPIFFVQQRPGLRCKPFEIVKFRTMVNLCLEDGVFLSDEARITRFGLFLRRTSIDELPELWNVLKGDMSLVGPRPLLMEYLPLYTSEQARRHEVKPGITGWAQVNGRNAIDWDEKFRLDVWYVDHQSFWLDLKIILSTIVKVFRSEGINFSGYATMKRFRGG